MGLSPLPSIKISLLLPQRMQLATVVPLLTLYIPPPLLAEFLEKVQLVNLGEESKLVIPPPRLAAEFPEKEQLVTVVEEMVLYIPPPPKLPEFPEKEQLVTVGED